MEIKTTYNIKENSIQELSDTAVRLNISRNELITRLFALYRNREDTKIVIHKSVKYQLSDDTCNFKKLHVKLESGVYETCLDMRKVFKLSVSFILSYAIEKYLDRLIEELIQGTSSDNYTYCYIFLRDFDDEDLGFTIYWTLPSQEKLKKYMR